MGTSFCVASIPELLIGNTRGCCSVDLNGSIPLCLRNMKIGGEREGGDERGHYILLVVRVSQQFKLLRHRSITINKGEKIPILRHTSIRLFSR